MLLFEILIFLNELINVVFCSSGAVLKDPLEVTHIAWFRVWYAPSKYNLGTIEIGLFGKMYPRTVRNFVAFANVTKNGAGYKGSKLLVIREAILGGVYAADTMCTIYGRYYKVEDLRFKPYGAGWLYIISLAGEKGFSSYFAVSFLDSPYDRTFGKVIRGMITMKYIRFLYPTNEKPTWDSELYISSCGVKIPKERFYVSTKSTLHFN